MASDTLVERLREDVFYGDARMFNMDRHNPLHMKAADRIEALEAALRWYADKDNWRTKGHPQIDWHDKPILHDQGKRAKQALEDQQP